MLSNINNNDFGWADQMIRFVHAITSNIDGAETDLIILDFATLGSFDKLHTGAYCTIRLIIFCFCRFEQIYRFARLSSKLCTNGNETEGLPPAIFVLRKISETAKLEGMSFKNDWYMLLFLDKTKICVRSAETQISMPSNLI